MSVVVEREPRPWLERWSPVGGLLFVAGLIIAFVGFSDTGDTPAEVIETAEEDSGWIDYTLLFSLLSLLFLGWFVGGLYARLRRLNLAAESTLALVGGVAHMLLFFVAFVVWTAPLVELDDEDDLALQQDQAATYLGIDDMGWILLAGAGVSAGLMIIAASLGALRARAVPAWAGWVGVALGIVSLATVAFFGIFAWMLWILVASVALLLQARGSGRLAAATPPD
jgi:hypothetical protein